MWGSVVMRIISICYLLSEVLKEVGGYFLWLVVYKLASYSRMRY